MAEIALHGSAHSGVQLGLAAPKAFHLNAAAAGLDLMGMTLAMNGVAIWIRYRFRKRIKW
jgi:hypothetical protein